jgi:hypothetical protein
MDESWRSCGELSHLIGCGADETTIARRKTTPILTI